KVAEEGDVEVHGEEVNAGDAAEGDVSVAHAKVPTIAEEPSIPSPTPSTLSKRVDHLELDKIAQALEITKLKRTGRMISKIDQDADVFLEDDKEIADEVADDAKDVQNDIDESAQD
nr:hypothetical protein [Tanacetum cinerariifolium]